MWIPRVRAPAGDVGGLRGVAQVRSSCHGDTVKVIRERNHSTQDREVGEFIEPPLMNLEVFSQSISFV